MIAAVLDDCYARPLLDGAWPGTTLSHNLRDNGWLVWMRTGDAVTATSLQMIDVYALQFNEQSLLSKMSELLSGLRIHHWFAVAHARGGYA